MSVYDGLPDSIRIGPALIKITVQEHVDKGNAWGEWDAHEHIIRLEANQPSIGSAADILWHEIKHGIWNLARLRSKEDQERIVGTMATWEIKLLQDNPALLAWLSSALKS